jgi:predicted unusual protein kinase regulating ubiquinone biosynthesis (AarF/ABC1/UbiB family)
LQKLSSFARARKAYRVALAVSLSYLFLSWGRRLFGKRWYERRIVGLHLRNAVRVKDAILSLQGLFIKIGQLLSVMSNFLPEAFQKPLEELQDRLPPRPFAEVAKRLEEELGRPPVELFQSFDETPIATASIGQAHRAVLKDGTEVVVKVQHYGIEDLADLDLGIVHRLTKVYAWFMDIRGIEHLYSQIRKMIEEELDFANEARAMQRISANIEEETDVSVPKVFEEFSTDRVLCTEYKHGVKISDTAALDRMGIDRKALAARVLRVWSRMVFKDGYYHADPHPGNILVNQKGHLVLLDFGATAKLSARFRDGITKLIEAAVKNDTESMIDACQTMGFLAEGADAEKMAKKMIHAMRNFLQNEVRFEGLNFREMKATPLNNSFAELIGEIGFKGIANTVQVPKEYVLLNRTITLLLGISNTLDPTYNPLDTVRPYAQKYLLQNKGGPLGYTRELVQRMLGAAVSLPDDLQKTMRKARAGELEFRSTELSGAAKKVAWAIRQLMFAILSLGGGFMALRLHELGMRHEGRWAFVGAAVCLLLALWPRRK